MSEPSSDPVQPDATVWAVLMTQTHRESYAAGHLARQGFVTYWPQFPKRIAHARKVKELPRPLFPGYVFVEINPLISQWRPLMSTHGVRSVIRFGERPALLPARFVAALRAREINGVIQRPASPYVPGDIVRVMRGAFEGTIAKILSADERDRVVILFELLQREVSASINVGDVARCGGRETGVRLPRLGAG